MEVNDRSLGKPYLGRLRRHAQLLYGERLSRESFDLQPDRRADHPSPGFDGNIWRFSYTSGYLTQILDPFHLGSGFWRRYEYATVPGLSPNPLSAVKDEQNKVLEGFAYDPQGRAWMTFAEGNQNYGTLAYDTPSVGHTTVTTRIDNTPTNQVSVFDLIYQGGRYLATRINGNCASCSGADGDDQTFTYDTSNHAITRTVGIGAEQVQTINTYDANGMILTRTEVVGQPLLQRTTTFT